MLIAVFGDVHGRVELCFKLCARWQRETGRRIDLVLQTGDLGAFFDLSRFDRATRRHAAREPTELGFLQDFAAPNPRVAALLNETTCRLVFVRGNHEDHAWLDRLEEQAQDPIFPVDAYRRVWCLKTGVPYVFSADGTTVTVLGIGRIGPPENTSVPEKPQFIQPYERDRIGRLDCRRCDVLLTHDTARDAVNRGSGMQEIREVLARWRPFYHFHGHTGPHYARRGESKPVTLTCRPAELTWDAQRGGLLRAGAMGILEWVGADEHAFQIVDAPWLREYNQSTWAVL
jgi:hypothetical protein